MQTVSMSEINQGDLITINVECTVRVTETAILDIYPALRGIHYEIVDVKKTGTQVYGLDVPVQRLDHRGDGDG